MSDALGAAAEVGRLFVSIDGDQTKFNSALDSAEGRASAAGAAISQKMISAGQTLTKFGDTATQKVTLPLAAAALGAIKFGSDMEETASKINVVFGDSADMMMQWSKTSIDTMGLAGQTALDMAAKYGDMATSFEFTKQAAADMGQQIVGRVADLASFKNISIGIADTALTGIFTGETESLKQLGVVMTQSNLDAYALAQGLNKTTAEMSQQELVSLRLSYVMDATSNAAGDFARTSDSTANQSRKAKEQLKELAVTFGTDLLGAANAVLTPISGLLKGFSDMSPAAKTAVLALAGIAAAAGPVSKLTGSMLTSFGTLNQFWKQVKADGFINAIKGTTAAENQQAAAAAKLNLAEAQHQQLVAQNQLANAQYAISSAQLSGNLTAEELASLQNNVAVAQNNVLKANASVANAQVAVSATSAAAGNAANAAATGATGVAATAATPAVVGFGAALKAAFPIIGIIGTAIAGLVALLSGIETESGKALEATKALTDEVEASKTAYEDKVASLNANKQVTSDLISEIKALDSVENKTNAQKARMADIVDQLNISVPELALSYDSLSGKLSMSTKELESFADKAMKAAEAEAEAQRLNDLYLERIKITKDLEDAQNDLANEGLFEKFRLTESILKAGTSATAERVDLLKDSLNDINEEISEFGENTQKMADDAAAQLEVDRKNLNEKDLIAEAEKALYDERELTLEEHYAAIQDIQNGANEYAAMDEQQRIDAIKEHLTAINDLEEQREEDLKEHQEAIEEATREHMDTLFALNEEGLYGEGKSLEKINEMWQKNQQDMANFQTNLQALTNAGFTELAGIFESKGYEMGGELQNAMDALQGISSTQWAAIRQNWSDNGGSLDSEFKKTLKGIDITALEQLLQLADTADAGAAMATSRVSQQFSTLPGSVQSSLDKTKHVAGTKGAEVANALTNEISTVPGATGAAFDNASLSIQNNLSMLQQAKALGTLTVSAYVAGVTNLSDEAKAAGSSTGIGYMDGLIGGLESRRAAAYAKADSIANGITKRIQNAWDEHSPSRVAEGLTVNFIKGLENPFYTESDKLLKASDHAADAIIRGSSNILQFPSSNNVTTTMQNDNRRYYSLKYQSSVPPGTPGQQKIEQIEFINKVKRAFQ